MKEEVRIPKRKVTWLQIVLCSAILLLIVFVAPKQANGNATTYTEDAKVENRSSFSTDVIYQIVTDRFYDGNTKNNPEGEVFNKSNPKKYHGGDWEGIKCKIEDGYFNEMGVTALWISSPVENITTIDPSNQCSSYHGYWARDFFKTNAAFGTMEEFSRLVQTAHAHGIKVIIDFAPNHTSTAEYGTIEFPEDGKLYRNGSLVAAFSRDINGIFHHENWTDFNTYENSIYHSMYGLADLNQQHKTVDAYLKDAIHQWMDMGIDGIRIDAVKHMSLGWQKSWLNSIYSKSGVFVFGEWYHGGTSNDVEMTNFINQSGMSLLDFRFANAIRNVFSETGTMRELYQVMLDTKKDYTEVNDQVTFIDNHDMSRFMTLTNSTRDVENAYVLLMTSRGVPTIYYGTECYATGNKDPYNRGDMPAFQRSSKAYQVISKLAPLRKTNPALAYGTTKERWINDDVLIYERQFGQSIVLVAVNRNQSKSYNIAGLYTNLAKGTYSDVMSKILGGTSITVMDHGKVNEFTLDGGCSAVWAYTKKDESKVIIGNIDPLMGDAGNEITICGRGFGSARGSVTFGLITATVTSWTDSRITAIIPKITAGTYEVTVNNMENGSSGMYGGFQKLTNEQVAVRFMVDGATTTIGTNVYLVGNVYELGNWDTKKAIGPMFHATKSIATYPNWFMDVSVPAGTNIEYKFIKKDATGAVIWEGGINHVVRTPKSGTATVRVDWTN